VSLGILGGVADVYNLRAGVSDRKQVAEIDGMEYLLEILIQRGAR
jgi:hypothetical protein